jgi:hypothetical protein
MGLSSSKKTTTTNSTSNTSSTPLDQYAPYINTGLSTANDILKGNQGNMEMLGGKALDIANGFGGANTALGSIYTGQNPAQATYARLQNAASNDPSIGTLTALSHGNGAYDAIGAGNPALASLQAMSAGQANGDTSQFYKDVIGGKYLANNPFVDTIAQQATDAATKAQNQRFALSGMDAGISTPYSQALGTAVANANNQVRYQNYNDERQLQQQAAGLSDAQYNATQDRNLQAANNLGSLYNQTGQLRLGAQQAKDANQLAATTALGSQYSNNNAIALNAANGDVNSQLQALGLVPGLTSAQLNALGAAASIPYTGVNNYANLINGLTAKYGNQSNVSNSKTVEKSNPSLMDTAMQGLSLGSSLLGGFGLGGMIPGIGSLGAYNPMAGNLVPQLTLGNSILGNMPLKQLSL